MGIAGRCREELLFSTFQGWSASNLCFYKNLHSHRNALLIILDALFESVSFIVSFIT